MTTYSTQKIPVENIIAALATAMPAGYITQEMADNGLSNFGTVWNGGPYAGLTGARAIADAYLRDKGMTQDQWVQDYMANLKDPFGNPVDPQQKDYLKYADGNFYATTPSHDDEFDPGMGVMAALTAAFGGMAGAASGAGGWATASNALDAPVWGSQAGAGAFGAGTGGTMADTAFDYWDFGDPTGGGAWSPPTSTGLPNVVQPNYDYTQFMNDIGIDPASTQFSGGTMTNAQIMQQIGADPSMLDQFKQAMNNLPPGSKEAAKGLIQKWMSGDTSALSALAKLGIPAALAAGVFEKPSSPLTGTLTTAANNAVNAAGAFAGMPSVGMMPSSQRAIDTANANVGAWQPYVDQAATYTNKAAGGIPSVNLDDYMNPYLRGVLDPQVRDIKEAAAAREQALRATVAKSGNDFRTPGTNRFNVEDDLLDRSTLRAISDASGAAYKGAFDNATTLATGDLNRDLSAGGAFNTMANTVGTQGKQDFTTLGAAGELEAKPAENALTKAADTAKLYTSVIPGTTSAVTATKNPSVLGQAVGAFGAYNAADKLGLLPQ